MSTLQSTFAKRLKSTRLAKGWSQERLSQESEIPVNTISRYERNCLIPGMQNLYFLCLKLEVSSDYLMGLGE